jgi:hypothetical protein
MRAGVWATAAVAGCSFNAHAPVSAIDDAAPKLYDAADAQGPCTIPEVTASLLPALTTSATLTIDGQLDEVVWSEATRVSFVDPRAMSDNQVTVSVLWTISALVFGFEVIDSHLETSGTMSYFTDDGAELYLDVEHDATPVMDADDRHYITNIENAVFSDPETNLPTVATSITTSGYQQEIAITWSDIGTAPSAGLVMGILLGNNDRDNDAWVQFDWNRLIETGAYARPNLWADIELLDLRAGCAAP